MVQWRRRLRRVTFQIGEHTKSLPFLWRLMCTCNCVHILWEIIPNIGAHEVITLTPSTYSCWEGNSVVHIRMQSLHPVPHSHRFLKTMKGQLSSVHCNSDKCEQREERYSAMSSHILLTFKAFLYMYTCNCIHTCMYTDGGWKDPNYAVIRKIIHFTLYLHYCYLLAQFTAKTWFSNWR